MAAEKIKPLKNFGQNFLQDKNIATKIISKLGDIADKQIIEIGPGMGALTEILLANDAKVTAFDIDLRAIEFLQNKFAGMPNLSLVHSDIREVKLEDYIDTKTLVIGNIPYNITNDILFWLFAHSDVIQKAVLTVQREVAQRYVATPRTKDYGITTLAMQLYGKAKIEFHIPASAFYPAPKVTSSVLSIDFTDAPQLDVDKYYLLKLIRAAFSQRRKMLSNALQQFLTMQSITTDAIPTNYAKLRAEELSLTDYIRLYNALFLHLN
ncbi:MAG: 16S rRNA (adenine(1518)-N(6)/adenine(1519)-N(6))-dimethyltransferase RsmA [Ignavibacteria bacterium]|jgi:16S rRNA (adenine1518-N6/adenine1519-N6)-dimethyltransferase|nr:16S rRNA (adenine(1518)-N(6)/adenine(1519)-N(6))-dimethyltransferase RsmA [Ignavibacteria bacterium]